MTRLAAAMRAGGPTPAPLARRFEAIIFDWDGTAVPDRQADVTRVRGLIEQACAAGLEMALVSGTYVGNVDGQLAARPAGPGELVLALNRGSEVFRVDRRRTAARLPADGELRGGRGSVACGADDG